MEVHIQMPSNLEGRLGCVETVVRAKRRRRRPWRDSEPSHIHYEDLPARDDPNQSPHDVIARFGYEHRLPAADRREREYTVVNIFGQEIRRRARNGDTKAEELASVLDRMMTRKPDEEEVLTPQPKPANIAAFSRR